jgi:hypothetical protein
MCISYDIRTDSLYERMSRMNIGSGGIVAAFMYVSLYAFCGDGTTCFTYEELHLTGSHARVGSDTDFASHHCYVIRARRTGRVSCKAPCTSSIALVQHVPLIVMKEGYLHALMLRCMAGPKPVSYPCQIQQRRPQAKPIEYHAHRIQL